MALAAAIAATASSAFDLLAPLWVVNGLGLDADDWARWRSWRMSGTCVGIVLLGLVAERWGARRMALASIGLAAVALALLSSGGDQGAGPLMALYGAGASGIFLALNVLTQDVSIARQATANAVYRSVSAAAGVAGPIVAIAFATAAGSLGGGLAAIAALLALTGLAVLPYRVQSQPARSWSNTIRSHRHAFMNGPLHVLLLVEAGFSSVLSVVTLFAAIRFTGALGYSTGDFAALVSATGLCLALGIAGCSPLIHRFGCRNLLIGLYTAVVAGALLLGFVPSRLTATIGFVVVTVGLGMGSAPSTLWIHRCAEGAPAAFVVAKLVQAGQLMLVTLAAAWLEPKIGITGLWIGAAGLGILLLLFLRLLPEPSPLLRVSREGV